MAKISQDDLSTYLDYGVDCKNRKVFLLDDIEDDSIGMTVKGLYLMDSQSNEPIELLITSLGGDEYNMFGLYDVIQQINSPVHTTAIGCCMSATPLLIAGGEKGFRSASPNTFFMVHESWDEFGAKRVDELAIDLKHYKEMGRRWASLMERHSNKPAKFWLNLCKKSGDSYFNAETALEWGIIDSIWNV